MMSSGKLPSFPPARGSNKGAVYLDVNNSAAGPVRATGDMIATAENLYIPKAETPYEYWNRLLAAFRVDDAAVSNEPRPDSEARRELSEEKMDKTLADSFPASDPPSWNMGRETSRLREARQTKVRMELTEESRDLLARHFEEGTELHKILDHAARNEVAGIVVYAFECEQPEAETLLEMARNHCPPAVKDIEHAIAARSAD